MKVIIAEKPSVAKNIAEALGASTRREGYFEGKTHYVTWAFGHLLELFDAKDYDEQMSSWKMENFPFVPKAFQYKVKKNGQIEDEGAKKQLNTIQRLIAKDEVTGVISACDFDREGQIIGDIILDFLKVEKPVERLLLNEWTPDEVKQGMEKLRSNLEMVPLKSAGLSRQWADWLIGINLTSVATLKYQRGYGKALNIGRVLLPTLKIIYDRDLEIEKFEKTAFHKLNAVFIKENGETYEGTYVLEGVDKFEAIEPLEAALKSIEKNQGLVTEKLVELKREYPGPLFNLSGLQGHVTSKAKGWTSDKVLKVAQGLYEKKLITYPRTASLALEESLIDKAKKVLEVHKKGLPFEDQVVFSASKRVFDNAKVESHSAIMPTYLLAKGLSKDEAEVYEAIKRRFVAQFMPVAEHEEVTLTTLVADTFAFLSKGRTQKVEGWRVVENIQSKDKSLPELTEGERVAVKKATIETKSTSPPKHHTEKTLLKVMESCGKKYKKGKSNDGETDNENDTEGEGDNEEMIKAILSGFSIGTPATRAETITKLKRVGYIEAKGKSLCCTPMGRTMVEQFPIKPLFDLEYTGRLEKTLSDIGKSERTMDQFMEEIIDFTCGAVKTIQEDDFRVIQDLSEDKVMPNALGKCPGCGSDVIEGEKGFGCSNWKSGCKFTIWKDDPFLKSLKVVPTRQTVINLLQKGEVYSSRFMSKKGQAFSAFLRYEKSEDSPYYTWKMRF